MKTIIYLALFGYSTCLFAQYTGGSGDGFGMWESTGDLSLPVNLIRFECVSEMQGIRLTWETASESGILGFQIERRDVDSTGYQLIATFNDTYDLRTKGSPSDGDRYVFIDKFVKPDSRYQYRVLAVNTNAQSELLFQSSVISSSMDLSNGFHLYHNYPNPFNPTTEISFELRQPGHVLLEVYNIRGQLINKIVDENFPEGKYSFPFRVRPNNATGIYICRLKVNDSDAYIKMTYIK